MTKTSEVPSNANVSYANEINLLDLILSLVRRWRLIAGMTAISAIISAGVAMRVPTVYSSSARLLVLEFIDQTQVLRVGDDGKLVFGGKKGIWRPADVSLIKGVLESNLLKQSIKSKFTVDNYTIIATQEKQPGFITVRVEGVNQAEIAKIATAAAEEAVQLTFRMGLLASPELVIDSMPKIKNFDTATILVRLLEPASNGIKIKPNRFKVVLLSTVTGFICALFLAFMMEYGRNLSAEDRTRLGEIRDAFWNRNADK